MKPLRIRWTPLALLIACGTARSPVAPSSAGDTGGTALGSPRSGEPARGDAATVDAGPADAEPADVAAVAGPVDAGPADAAPVASCREGYHADNQSMAELFPKTFHARATDGMVCDLKERIVIVDDKTVTVLARPKLKKTRAPVARREKLDDRCGGPGGGHAGCSITFKRFWSAALGAGYVEFGNSSGNFAAEDPEQSKMESCREDSPYAVVATCSTAKRFLLVKYKSFAYGEPRCWHLQASLWEGPVDQGTQIDGDIDRTASVGDHLVFRFPAVATADRAITLGFDGHAGTATLKVGEERERCVAFRVNPFP